MIYRCLNCDHQEERGILPTATCGTYAIFLLAVPMGCIGLATHLVKTENTGAPPPPNAFVEWVLIIIVLLLIPLGAMLLHLTLSCVEYFIVARRRCPQCGSRRWSWGYTSGFGL